MNTLSCIRAAARPVAAALFAALLVLGTGAPAAIAQGPDQPRVLERTHAHNDYEHERPLYDALDHGFVSVEVDVWLIGDELFVAHDLGDVRPDRTLRSLYLDPLRETIRDNDGSVHPGWDGSLQLLVDVKSDAERTYRALDRVLGEYDDILTRFEDGEVRQNAVTAVLSGNRARDLMESDELRYAGYDGRVAEDLGTGTSADFMPLVSADWADHFEWDGEGAFPDAERAQLREIAAEAHQDGYRLRFWNTPEDEDLWRELVDADVDQINTDDLAGLRDFLLEYDR